MSFNGSGTFVINSTGQPVVANTVISATVFNALTADLASGLTNCITKDGQSTPTANIPMGSNKITGLANGTLIGDAANLGQVQSTVAKLISITGTDTVLGTMSPTLTAYAAGQLFYFVAGGANTGAVTLNIDGLGAKAITRDGSTALAAGDINSGEIVVVIYDGTRFQMINAANSFGNTTINGTLTVTGNTGLQANVSVTSALSVGGTFAVTGAATLGSTLAVTGKSDLPTVSTASANAAVAVITDLSAAGASITSANVGTAVVTTGTVTNLTATSASVASVNAGVALLTTATVTNLTATGASIASANLGNAVISALTLTGVSVASANVGVANITDLRATGASVTSANVGTAVITTGTVTNLTATSASVASVNAAVALITTGTITNLTSTAASVASANVGTAVITTLTATGASIASANAGNVQATIASVGSANLGTAVITTGTLTNLTATSASVASVNAGVALVTTGTVTNLTSTAASIASANIGVAAIGSLSFTGASIASLNAGVANITDLRVAGASVTSANLGTAVITTGNLTFSSTAQRITGDFSSSNPVYFQSSTTDGGTSIGAIPNGTGTSAFVNLLASSSGTNCNRASLQIYNGSEMSLRSVGNGTFTFVPMTFYTGGSERVRIDTSGNVGIGTASPYNLAGYGGLSLNGSSGSIFSLFRNGTKEARVQVAGDGFSLISDGAFPILFKPNDTERMRIDSSGNVGIGGTAGADTRVQVLGTAPSSGGQSRGYLTTQTIPSSTTTNFIGFGSVPATQAASFTCSQIYHYYAAQGSLGAGSAVTTQYGYFADSTLTGATNNYGFYSNIASGSNRWNFYAAGTAQNYFAGNTGVGTTTIAGKFNVGGGRSFFGANSETYSIAVGYTQARCNSGQTYYIGATDSATPDLVFSNAAGTERMRIADNGEVIVGITDQGAYNLQCNGTGVWGAGAYVNGSDARLKDDITTLNDGLNVVSQLRPVTFKYKPDYSKDQNVQTGFIAQELQAVLAGKDYVDGIVQAGPDHLNVAYQSLIPILTKAIQELTARVAELEAK